MIKGINHQVIEITDTQNRYYERALLVLRPEYASISHQLLEKEARSLLQKMDTISTAKPKAVLRARIFSAVMYFLVGALLSAIIYTVI